jgi:predicted phage terminase large subunit-like protein
MAKENLLSFARLTFRGYTPNWHHKVLAEKLMETEKGDIDRLMVLMPPRHGKSELASVRFPAWFLGRNPSLRVIATSYSARLAETFGRKVREIVADPKFRLTFGFGLSKRSRASDRWETTEGGGYIAAGVGGSITGMGGDLLIVDDPFKNQEDADSKTYRDKVWEWYQSTLYTRIEKGGKIVVILTRWHEDDLAGRLLASGNDDWHVVSFPAVAEGDEEFRNIGEPLWEDKYDSADLQRIKTTVGTRVWNALYQQRPAPQDGAVFKKGWWRFYDRLPDDIDSYIQSWDMTFSDSSGADFVVGQVWALKGSARYLVDQVRERMDFVKAIQAVREMTEKYPEANAKYIEDKANGPAVISALRNEIQGLIPVNPKGSKIARANSVCPVIEAGNVFLKKGARFSDELMEEASLFPAGKNDDMVDAMTQALSCGERRTLPKAAFSGVGRSTNKIFKKY